ncbi:hypothetical protein H257_08903 [Aphanomyces astaci]|uniref:protein-tyrosine-phosphatase n=1 Tax=Aphanomyces astaci TaxID=112090 RepID=W4GEV0_APHAT|nr:hypothetical protein H257_08903 [Aphanomyces astaci]ETV77493.1 hypothetical protein H257_08903 [Aphanomyces astaci]|eukprot:XP_009833280.1 hypothetical protein H257_08903 [Aphanomyces astaci]
MAGTSSTVEILPDRLYMHLSDDDIGPVLPHTTYLNVSPDVLVYINYFDDFGPLHLGHTFRFCAVLSDQLTAAKTAHVQLHVLVSSTDIHAQVNMVCLLACWGVLYNRQAPESAVQPFRHMNLPSFHDATDEACPFQVAVVDVVRGFHRALSLQYTCRQSFNVADYLHYEKVEHGDLNWISPKFVAFAGPQDVATPDATTHPPGFFIPMFMKANVTLVVRLNEALYDPSPFRSAGIAHLDLGFPDGANPPSAILRRFLAACEATPGAVAVHCKAGLGRTGTVIGCYMIKHDGFKAKDAIGWLRLCRPGSVIGEQQDYMLDMERKMIKAAAPRHVVRTTRTTPQKRSLSMAADASREVKNQGDRLLVAKRRHIKDRANATASEAAHIVQTMSSR